MVVVAKAGGAADAVDHGRTGYLVEREDEEALATRLIEVLDRAARHEAVGQVIGDVADPGEPQLLERLAQLRPDAFERVDLGEQRIEHVGAHGADIPC